jgi:hypothetical protein
MSSLRSSSVGACSESEPHRLGDLVDEAPQAG